MLVVVCNVVKFDLGDKVPHASRHKERVSGLTIGDPIEEVVFVVSNAPYVVLVQDKLLLASLKNR